MGKSAISYQLSAISNTRKIIISLLILVFGGFYFVWAQSSAPLDTVLPPAIVSFSADLPAVMMDMLENRQAKTHLSWDVVNLPPEDRVALQIYQLNQWGDVFPEEVLPATDSREITVEPPLGFGPPTYRLSILNKQKQVIEERALTIPYDMDGMADWTPQVVSFTSDAQNVNVSDLVSHKARVNVAWQVDHRLPNTNITFEQLLEDGTTAPVELARPYLWLPSTGSGVVSPILPQQAEDPVRLRLRVVDMTNGKTLDSAEVVLPLVGAAVVATPIVNTRPPVIVPTAVPTMPPTVPIVACRLSPLDISLDLSAADGCDHYSDSTVSVQINSFTLTNQHAVEAIFGARPRGDVMTASWNVSGNVQVLLEVYDRHPIRLGALPPLQNTIDNLPPVGSTDIFLTGGDDGVRVVLWAYDWVGVAAGNPPRHLAFSIVDVPVLLANSIGNCVPTFHFTAGDTDPHGCNAPVDRTAWQGAYEPFERGFMMWFTGTNTIYVMDKDGTYLEYVESQYSALPDNPVTDTPPSGLTSPLSGFGKVWGNFSAVRDALGWALGVEQTYTYTVESSSIANYFYVVLPDGRVAQLHKDYTWNYEAPP